MNDDSPRLQHVLRAANKVHLVGNCALFTLTPGEALSFLHSSMFDDDQHRSKRGSAEPYVQSISTVCVAVQGPLQACNMLSKKRKTQALLPTMLYNRCGSTSRSASFSWYLTGEMCDSLV